MDDLLDRLRDELRESAATAPVRYPAERIAARERQHRVRRTMGLSVVTAALLGVVITAGLGLSGDASRVSTTGPNEGTVVGNRATALRVLGTGPLQLTWVPERFEFTREGAQLSLDPAFQVSTRRWEIELRRSDEVLRARWYSSDGAAVLGSFVQAHGDSSDTVWLGPLRQASYWPGRLVWVSPDGGAVVVEGPLSRDELVRVATSILDLPGTSDPAADASKRSDLVGLPYREATALLRGQGRNVRWALGPSTEDETQWGRVVEVREGSDGTTAMFISSPAISAGPDAPPTPDPRFDLTPVAGLTDESPGYVRGSGPMGSVEPVIFLNGELVGFMAGTFVTVEDALAGRWPVITSVRTGDGDNGPSVIVPLDWEGLIVGDLSLRVPPNSFGPGGARQLCERPGFVLMMGGPACDGSSRTAGSVGIRQVGPGDADIAERCAPGAIHQLYGCYIDTGGRWSMLLDGGTVVEIVGSGNQIEAVRGTIMWADGEERWPEKPGEAIDAIVEALRSGDDAALRVRIDPTVDVDVVVASAKALLAAGTTPPASTSGGPIRTFTQVATPDGSTIEIVARYHYDIGRARGRWLVAGIAPVDRPSWPPTTRPG